MSTILVTGARGNIGSRIVAKLIQQGVHVRALVRPSKEAAFDRAVEVVTGSYDDAAALTAAMTGVSRAMFITAGPALAEQDAALAAAAKTAGVGHAVKLSVYGARAGGSEIPAWHHDGEQRIAATGIATTFVRPSSFASNALGWLRTLRATGKAFGALGSAALPVIHPDDIADVAVRALTAPGHDGKIHEITGPASITAAEQVAILAEVFHMPAEYVNVEDEVAVQGMIGAGMPRPMADAMIHLIQALRGMGHIPPNDTVAQVLGRPAKSFRQWATDHAATQTQGAAQ